MNYIPYIVAIVVAAVVFFGIGVAVGSTAPEDLESRIAGLKAKRERLAWAINNMKASFPATYLDDLLTLDQEIAELENKAAKSSAKP